MEERNLTCIGCPKGCALTVCLDGNEVGSISGNTCRYGKEYARREVTAPARTVTTTVKVKGSSSRRVSVKTASEIPKELIFQCIGEIRQVTLQAPVRIGDIVLSDVAGTGVNVIATKNADLC